MTFYKEGNGWAMEQSYQEKHRENGRRQAPLRQHVVSGRLNRRQTKVQGHMRVRGTHEEG